ncbi:T6SS effector BTH_I2691 family protein [Mixta tenebrionis]|uniref:Toxin VasX N-terminal region domain-containing protein n=1 Tax=Mixta tenebrionis TaxID=2562439 RepID=A0A506VA83_9GAMM|nr:T6SS effector BTH_I2691 family protein [Mixta tenebrionis]TPW42200.1 hypothetical protein FKM52_09110 [Mixta tenebrionis]
MEKSNQGCGFCSRYGLPVLPIRPGIADKDDKLPHLPEDVYPSIVPGGKTSYTGRLLREGYLHVYDEMIDRWQDYYVTKQGYYYPLPGSGYIPPGLLSGEMKPCITKPEELARASLVTLPIMPPPMKNGVFWFGWSENKWTPAVRKKHEDLGVRQKTMQKFDMDAWLNNRQGENLIGISRLSDVVAEHNTLSVYAEMTAYSASSFQPLPAASANLLQAAEQLMPGGGAIIVLQDPVAVLQEISSLLSYQVVRDLYANEKFLWKYVLASTITGMKEAMTRQCARDVISETEFRAMRDKFGVNTRGAIPLLPSPELAEQSNAYLDSNLQRIVHEKWQTYAAHYDEKQLEQFVKEFNEETKRYDDSVVIPATEMYLAWFKSELTTGYFKYNFDKTDIESGFDYIQTVNYCITGMQDKALTFRYFTEQLKKRTDDDDNILMRALVFNQDKFSERFEAYFQDKSSLWDKPWSSFADAFKDTLGQMHEAGAGYLGAFLGNLTGSVSYLLQTAAKSRLSYRLFGIMAASVRRAFIPIPRVATEAEFVEDIVRVMGRNAGIAGDKTEDVLRMYVRWEVRRLKIDGLPLSGNGERNYIGAIDLEAFDKLAALPESQRNYRLQESLRTEAEVDRLLFARWQNHVNASFSSIRQSVPLALGVVSMALQTAALWVSMDFSHKPLTASQQEARNRFWAGTLSLTGTTAGTIETAIIRFNKLGAAFSGSAAEKIAGWFATAGRWLGAAGGAVTAYYDYAHISEEWNHNRKGLAFAYGASALSGLYLSVAPFINWMWISDALINIGRALGIQFLVRFGICAPAIGLALSWISAGILVIAAFYISWKQTNDLQKWLEKTMWGITPEGISPEKHPTMQIEMQSLKDIMQVE